MGVCNCSMFCCTLLYVHSSIAIILMGKRELIALLNLSSWCLVMVERLFLAVPRGCLQFVIVVFPDQTHLLFLILRKTMFMHGSMNFRQWGSRDSPFSRGVQLFPGKVQLFPIETHIIFQGGGVRTPSPLLDPHMMF